MWIFGSLVSGCRQKVKTSWFCSCLLAAGQKWAGREEGMAQILLSSPSPCSSGVAFYSDRPSSPKQTRGIRKSIFLSPFLTRFPFSPLLPRSWLSVGEHKPDLGKQGISVLDSASVSGLLSLYPPKSVLACLWFVYSNSEFMICLVFLYLFAWFFFMHQVVFCGTNGEYVEVFNVALFLCNVYEQNLCIIQDTKLCWHLSKQILKKQCNNYFKWFSCKFVWRNTHI